MEGRKYFHELSKEEICDLRERKVGWKYIREHYMQPSWCSYPNALDFSFGCWHLTDTMAGVSMIKSYRDCMKCDCYKRKE